MKTQQKMNFLKSNLHSLKKKTLQYFYPNQNPTDIDKYAFNLLDKGEVDLFIQFMDSNPVNLLVLDYSSSNLLMKAIGIPTYSNPHVKMLTQDQKVERALVAVKYLLARGMDVNYQNKKGITPLISACHWGEDRIVKLLLQAGADPNLSSEEFCVNPLLSASFKNYSQIQTMLFQYGGNPQITQHINNKSKLFTISSEQMEKLHSTYHVVLLIRQKHYQQQKSPHKLLASVSQNQFNQICMNV